MMSIILLTLYVFIYIRSFMHLSGMSVSNAVIPSPREYYFDVFVHDIGLKCLKHGSLCRCFLRELLSLNKL